MILSAIRLILPNQIKALLLNYQQPKQNGVWLGKYLIVIYNIMNRFRIGLLLICITCIWLGASGVALKQDIQAIITNYEKGNTEQCLALIKASQPESNDEKAVVNFYKALLATDAETAKTNFLLLINNYPKSVYAQKAIYEIGTLYLLDREYEKALHLISTNSFYNLFNCPGKWVSDDMGACFCNSNYK